MTRPVVVLAEPLGPAATHELERPDDLEVRHVTDDLPAALVDADALVVRDEVRVDADLLGAAPRLRVVACAGSGHANVDLAAASRAGVLVVTAPDAEAVSAAELALALALTAARRTTPGTELAGKTLGLLGLGPVATLVAERAGAFGMRVLATDPEAPAGYAARLGVRAVPLEDLLAESDVLSLHAALTAANHHLLDADRLALVRPGLLLVNVAADDLVDEAALATALEEGRVAGAALDLDDPDRHDADRERLLALASVSTTPHLRAATREAQERLGREVVASLRAALAGELVASAVNLRGGPVAEEVRPGVPLALRLGRLLAAWCDQPGAASLAQVDVEVRGEVTAYDVTALESAALAGVLDATVVSADAVAAERGVGVRLLTTDESPDHRNVVSVVGLLTDGTRHAVSGTLVGLSQRHRLVEVDGFQVDLEPTDHLALLRYADRPGVVGVLGRLLGAAGLNIAGMQVSRDQPGGEALVALRVDSAVPVDLLERISAEIDASAAAAVDLV